MGYYFSLIFLTLFAILENSVLIDFRLLDGQPSLVLVAVIAWAWHADFTEAIFWAFLGGILVDVLNPIIPTGVSIIALIIVIFAVKAVERIFYEVSIFALIGFVAFGTILHHIIIFLVFNGQGISLAPLNYIQNYTLPTLAFNLIGTMPMYWFLRRFQKRILQRQSAWAVTPR